MLTEQQIESVRKSLCGRMDCGAYCTTVESLAAAYERMTVLRQRWYDAKVKPTSDEMWREFIWALEG